ncbi:MAG: TnpV protein [Candidatus Ornithomonoglobus sp.]
MYIIEIKRIYIKLITEKGMRKMAEITYKTSGDYQIPELTVPTEEHKIGKYGMMRRTYLKEHRRSLYTTLLMKGELLEHLEEIDKTATEQVQKAVEQMAKTEGVTEIMKSKDPLRWTGLMNNFLHSAEETVLSELVYS